MAIKRLQSIVVLFAGLLFLTGLAFWLVPGFIEKKRAWNSPSQTDSLAASEGELVQDSWEAAYYLDGARAGNIHTQVFRVDTPEGLAFRHRVLMNLKVQRYGSTVPMKMEQSSLESPEGKVRALGMVQYLDQGKQVLEGRVDGENLFVSQGKIERRVDFPPNVLGPYAQELLLGAKSQEPNAAWSVTSFELSLQAPTQLDGRVLGSEETEVPQGGHGKAKLAVILEKLDKVEIVPRPVKVGGQEIVLPSLEVWCRAGKPVKSRVDMPGLGPITLVRTSREEAERPAQPGEVPPDLGAKTLVFLDRAIPRVHEQREVAYQFSLPGDRDPAKAFMLDARQVASGDQSSDKNGSFTLVVKGEQEGYVRAPQPGKAALESNFYIDSADPQVTVLAAKAIGDEKDAWRRALRIELFVHQGMSSTSAVGFARASQVARDLKGDCRQHAMLAAAMCRASGVPARTALGLVYITDQASGKPALGFHMWTEVWAGGSWRGIDATLGQGRIGPGHVKISDTTWTDPPSLAPLLPVLRVMGRLQARVVDFR